MIKSKWKERVANPKILAEHLKAGVPKLLAPLVTSRNVSPENYKKYTMANHAHLSDPFSLDGIREAKAILLEASKLGWFAVVVGDYDCDGVCSSAIASFILSDLKIAHDIFLPDRLEHGYGLNAKTIAAFKTRFANKIPDLVFVVDCGTASEPSIKDLKEWGVKKIIVVDHHIADGDNKTVSADALINWRLCGFNEQCAAGQMYTLARAFEGKIDLVGLLPFAAVGTVADVVPICGDNRIIVRNGLSAYKSARTPGLDILSKVFGAGRRTAGVSQEDIAFYVAPKINAVGRLDTAYTAHQTVMEHDRTTAYMMAKELEEKNKERKGIQAEIVASVLEQIKDVDKQYGVLVYDKSWHIGVVGIVASRIVDKFGVPTFVFGSHNGVIKGSGRSIPGINLKRVLDDCSELFETYGGHEMAAGATLKEEMLPVAHEVFINACRRYWHSNSVETPVKYFDMDIDPTDITEENIDLVRETIYPYCKVNNPEPVFRLPSARINGASQSEGPNWRRINFYCDDVLVPFDFFTQEFLADQVDGKLANVYFSFPQKKSFEYEPSMRVVGLELEEA